MTSDEMRTFLALDEYKKLKTSFDDDIMTIKDFLEYVNDGLFTDDDGFGYFLDISW